MSLSIAEAEKEIRQFIDQFKDIYNHFLSFIDNPDSKSDDDYTNLIKTVNNYSIEKNKEVFNHFLGLLVDISNNHYRQPGFYDKLERILIEYKISIKENYSNLEIYEQFKNNKRLLYFVIKEEILTFDTKIKQLIEDKIEKNYQHFSDFFIPEIKKSDSQNQKNDKEDDERIKYYLSHLEEYESKRQIGENDSYICSLIREDSIEGFVSYVNQMNISYSSKIKPSIFETNSFLNENEPTLIEYAAFFGSIQIFQYLFLNKAKVNGSIWQYAIHSNNPDLLQNYIEQNRFKPDDETYEEVFKESIKCHHNDIALYIEENLINKNQEEEQNQKIKFEERVYNDILKYHNYSFLKPTFNQRYLFYYLCKYDYSNIVSLLIESQKDIFEKKIIQMNFFYAICLNN